MKRIKLLTFCILSLFISSCTNNAYNFTEFSYTILEEIAISIEFMDYCNKQIEYDELCEDLHNAELLIEFDCTSGNLSQDTIAIEEIKQSVQKFEQTLKKSYQCLLGKYSSYSNYSQAEKDYIYDFAMAYINSKTIDKKYFTRSGDYSPEGVSNDVKEIKDNRTLAQKYYDQLKTSSTFNSDRYTVYVFDNIEDGYDKCREINNASRCAENNNYGVECSYIIFDKDNSIIVFEDAKATDNYCATPMIKDENGSINKTYGEMSQGHVHPHGSQYLSNADSISYQNNHDNKNVNKVYILILAPDDVYISIPFDYLSEQE